MPQVVECLILSVVLPMEGRHACTVPLYNNKVNEYERNNNVECCELYGRVSIKRIKGCSVDVIDKVLWFSAW